MDLDKVVAMRRAYRRSVEGIENEINEELLKGQEVNLDLVYQKVERLNSLNTKIRNCDDNVLSAMVDLQKSEKELDDEVRIAGEFEERVTAINAHVEKLNAAAVSAHATESVRGDAGQYKFPKLKPRMFTGDISEWIGWWASFKPIHLSTTMSKAEKFQHLVQVMEPGSRAADCISAYPQSEGNYEKALEGLKVRFGNEDMLSEHYIRDLIKLVSSRDKMTITKLYDQLEAKLQSLETLGHRTKTDCFFLFPMVESCLQEETLRAWKRKYVATTNTGDKSAPKNKLELLMDFLKDEVRHEEEILLAHGSTEKAERKRKTGARPEESKVPTAASLAVTTQSKRFKEACLFCDGNHVTRDCRNAFKLKPEQRFRKIQGAGACFVCFRKNHLGKDCRTGIRCQVCSKKHNVLLCPDRTTRTVQNNKCSVSRDASNEKNDKRAESTVNCLSKAVQRCLIQVPLQTLRATITGANGREKIIRVLVDSGAQKSAILKKTAEELGLHSTGKVRMIHQLYGGKRSDPKMHSIFTVRLISLEGAQVLDLKVVDEDCIANGVPSTLECVKSVLDGSIHVTDDDEDGEIEVLLANDVYGQILTGRIKRLTDRLVAIDTKLGWVLSGSTNSKEDDTVGMLATVSMINQATIQQLWDLEVIGIKDPIQHKSQKEMDEDVKFHFLQTVRRNVTGRFEIKLPWIMSKNALPNNKEQAFKRLESATSKLNRQGLYEKYEQVFLEWKQEGIIEEAPLEESGSTVCHYLPHRPVIKESSQTTKIRPVFDASCKTRSTFSLNDCLAKGPNLLELIPAILLRFRLRQVGAVADVKKAFLQISVAPEDRDVLRFFWWENDRRTLRIFRHCRVVFGVNCSPFLLNAVIESHLRTYVGNEAVDAGKLLSSLYVDNCVISLESQEAYLIFRESAVRMMEQASMDLRLWESNTDDTENGKRGTSSVLGLEWDKDMDTLTPRLENVRDPGRVTKRKILSATHSLYDPLGYFTPVSLEPKLILREVVALKSGWDDEVPEEVAARFRKWCEGLKVLSALKIPRTLAPVNVGEGCWTLHIFMDASVDAFAAAAFIRVEMGTSVTVRLIMAKARVAPLNATIPRKELIGCLIGARLAATIQESVGENWPATFWTDSTTVLGWIRRVENWGVFVNNRVSEIRKLTRITDWRHVPGTENPADLPSRGCSPQRLIGKAWWEGPAWLYLDEDSWPKGGPADLENAEPSIALATRSTEDDPRWFVRFSNYDSNIRLLAWIMRWTARCRKINMRTDLKLELEPEEIDQAERMAWKLIQENGENLERCKMELVQTKDKLWAVKTKLFLRKDLDSFKLPILLPSKHLLVTQLIMKLHLENHHAKAAYLIGKLRDRVWITNAKKTIQRVTKSCTVCRRFDAKRMEYVEGPLPEERVKDAQVFETIGVDLGGPLYLKDGSKVWFALFTCAVYRAIHLELVESLSTDSFILALRRFVARRRRPTTIISDQGTNFKGLSNLMEKLDWEKIKKGSGELSRIKWKFNPATASWWGGFFERLIGMVKNLMRRIFGKAVLDLVELHTLTCEIEAILNSRPLTYVSEDPEDLIPLSPAMFMQDSVEYRMPDMDEIESKMLKRRWRYRQTLREELRSRFRKEYLANLVHLKGRVKPQRIEVGDVVMIGFDDRKWIDWPLGKVVWKLPGRDGVVRLVKLRTASGETLRPLKRLYPLELETVPRLPQPIPVTGTNDGITVPATGTVDQGGVAAEKTEVEDVSGASTPVMDNVSGPVTAPERVEGRVTTRSGRRVRKPERLVQQMMCGEARDDVCNLYEL